MVYHQKSAVSKILCEGVLSDSWPPSELRLATSGMAWKGEENETVKAIPADEIKWAQWFRVARNFQLRVGLKDRRREAFDGFVREVRGKPSLLKGETDEQLL